LGSSHVILATACKAEQFRICRLLYRLKLHLLVIVDCLGIIVRRCVSSASRCRPLRSIFDLGSRQGLVCVISRGVVSLLRVLDLYVRSRHRLVSCVVVCFADLLHTVLLGQVELLVRDSSACASL